MTEIGKNYHCSVCGSGADLVKIYDREQDNKIVARLVSCKKLGCLHVDLLDCGHCLRKQNGA